MATKDRTFLLKENPKLFDATLDEFSSKPFSLASTNEIIERAEYNKGSFYYRFKTKEELYYALIDSMNVDQISLFRSKHIHLKDIDKVAEILNLSWENLMILSKIEARYLDLLTRTDNEDTKIKELIEENCIESFYMRLIGRLEEIVGKDSNLTEQFLFFNSFEHYYHHFPFADKDHLNNHEIEKLTSYLLGSMTLTQKEANKEAVSINPFKFSNPLFILSDIDMDIKDSTSISSLLADERQLIDQIKSTFKIRKVDLKNLITSGIQKNLIDFTHLGQMVSLPFYEKSYHLLDKTEKSVLVMTYLTLIGHRLIVADHVFDLKNPVYLELLFPLVLPLLAKTSKIVVLDDEFPINIGIQQNLYLYTPKRELEKLDPTYLKDLEANYLIVSYLNEQGYIVTKRIDKSHFKWEAYAKIGLLELKTYSIVRSKDLFE